MKKVPHIIGSVARTLLGIVFLFSGFVKAVDPLGTVYKIEDYLKAFGGIFTDMLPLAFWAAMALIAAEWLLGVCLTFNVKTQWTSWLTLAFMLVMTPLTLWIALTDPVSDCGCFGDAIVLSNWATFWKNIVLLALVITLLVCKKHIPQLFVNKAEACIAGGGLLFAVALMVWTLYHLPIMDFRPYKIGNNIPELMEVPEDAPQDEYEIRFIYEKDGQQQEFTLENYPKGDSTWTFVDQKSKLIRKGYEAPIHDFEIMTTDYEDITYDILESETPVTLVIMYDLDKADLDQLGKVTELYHHCLNNLEPFYILTGSGEQTRDNFCFDVAMNDNSNTVTPFNHPDGVFCTCDPVTLKTIVRANPGVIVVQNGNIIDKYNIRNK